MDQNQVGLCLLKDLLHAQQALTGNGGECLPGFHDIEIVLRRELENMQHGVQHLPVLGGHTAQALNARPALQLLHQRRHFDGLRPGAEDGHHTDCFHRSSPLSAVSGDSALSSERRFSLLLRKIRPDTAPAAQSASSSSMAFSSPLVVSTTAHRPRMALMI